MQPACEPTDARPVEAGATTQLDDLNAIPYELLAEFPNFVKADNDELVAVGQPS